MTSCHVKFSIWYSHVIPYFARTCQGVALDPRGLRPSTPALALGAALGATPQTPSTCRGVGTWNLELRMYVVVCAKAQHIRSSLPARLPLLRLGQGKGRWSRASIDPFSSLVCRPTDASITQSANEGLRDPRPRNPPPPWSPTAPLTRLPSQRQRHSRACPRSSSLWRTR